jgi:Sulfotransferase domain
VKRPNFFIVGAPKCGTTALSEYLRDNPAVFMSRPKEPHWFSSDFDYYANREDPTLDGYLRLFERAGDRHLAVGEASVWYLYSAAALPAIVAFDPNARVIAMVRNPVEMVPSLHSQLLYTLDEDEPNLELAWRLQAERARGERIPSTCRVPEFLQYGAACSLGAQIERARTAVPVGNLKVITFDDFVRDTRRVYLETEQFLGVPDDARVDFPRVNANKQHRYGWLGRVTQRPPQPLVAAARTIKRAAGIERLNVIPRIKARNRRVADRAQVDPAFRRMLADHFRPDVEHLGALIDRDLTHWCR